MGDSVDWDQLNAPPLPNPFQACIRTYSVQVPVAYFRILILKFNLSNMLARTRIYRFLSFFLCFPSGASFWIGGLSVLGYSSGTTCWPCERGPGSCLHV